MTLLLQSYYSEEKHKLTSKSGTNSQCPFSIDKVTAQKKRKNRTKDEKDLKQLSTQKKTRQAPIGHYIVIAR